MMNQGDKAAIVLIFVLTPLVGLAVSWVAALVVFGAGGVVGMLAAAHGAAQVQRWPVRDAPSRTSEDPLGEEWRHG